MLFSVITIYQRYLILILLDLVILTSLIKLDEINNMGLIVMYFLLLYLSTLVLQFFVIIWAISFLSGCYFCFFAKQYVSIIVSYKSRHALF